MNSHRTQVKFWLFTLPLFISFGLPFFLFVRLDGLATTENSEEARKLFDGVAWALYSFWIAVILAWFITSLVPKMHTLIYFRKARVIVTFASGVLAIVLLIIIIIKNKSFNDGWLAVASFIVFYGILGHRYFVGGCKNELAELFAVTFWLYLLGTIFLVVDIIYSPSKSYSLGNLNESRPSLIFIIYSGLNLALVRYFSNKLEGMI